MRNLKFLAVFAIFFIGSISLSAQDFGVVDVENVLNTYPAKLNADTELEGLFTRHQNEIKKKQDALLAIENEVKAQTEGKSQAEIQAILPELEAKQQDYMNKQQDLITYQQAASKEVAEKEDSLLRPIEDKVKASINKVAAAKGLKYVMEKSILLYANGIDITADVKKDLGIN